MNAPLSELLQFGQRFGWIHQFNQSLWGMFLCYGSEQSGITDLACEVKMKPGLFAVLRV